MAAPVTLRLDSETRERLARLARRKGTSTSEVIREAIQEWMEKVESVDAPYEAVADLLGIVRGGDPKRSEQTGRRFRELLKRRGSTR